MGYYTDYIVSANVSKLAPDERINLYTALGALDIFGYDLEEYTERDDYFEFSISEITWYEHETDMREISKRYPEIIFKVEGHGEDYEDIWIEYYKAGKMQYCPAIITYDDFNEDKLC